MASTPAAPERLHTPPPPLHGTRYDDWEPYSPPRRSSRVAAQRSRHASEEQSHRPEPSKKRPAPRSARAFTPVGSSKQDAPAPSFTASPPSSPTSPHKRPSAKKSVPNSLIDDPFGASDNDSDPFISSSKGAFGVLPTPSKTPSRKDKARPLSAFASTARVLFHDRPANIDDAMPSPRKSKQSKKRTAFTLPSFIDECEDEESEKIQIYTDFRERVPSVDEEEDNPFITKKPDENDEPNTRTSVSPRAAKRRMTKEEAEMDRRARNGEGFISVFRGKKVFTEYKDRDTDDSASEPESPLGASPVRRAVGSMARRRVTRSTIQPRLLFPTDEQKRAREAAAAAKAAEEDSTDIDASVQLATPRKRAHFARAPRPSTANQPPMFEPLTRPVKRSPFDQWRRTKAGTRSVSGTKREGGPLEAASSKKTRSSARASTPTAD
ncbi:hypothetical protein B0J12DRAFT_603158 [Macrophomina phaseolina]|uniref:Uncharacterized protein n=1 Tax=Macrophomina phaseolina TaxID=35725 RepID=A0ABQ8G6A2_9PEZI|nr:hypothetical protein B0J12DRAFT_603158 [Macrophomina phaseolina]